MNSCSVVSSELSLADLHQTNMHLDKQKQQQQLLSATEDSSSGCGVTPSAVSCYNHNNNQGFLQQPHLKPDVKDVLEGYPVKPEAADNGQLVEGSPGGNDTYTSNPDGLCPLDHPISIQFLPFEPLILPHQ